MIIALSLALTLPIILPPSINASKATTRQLIDALTANAKFINSTVVASATEIECSLQPTLTSSITVNGTKFILTQPLMNDSFYYNLTSIPDVTHVIPILEQVESKNNYPLSLVGVSLDSASLLDSYPSLLPANITAGRNLEPDDSGVVVIEEHLANHFDVSVGGIFNILGKNFEVVGIEGQEALNATCHATMNLADVQALTNNAGEETIFKVLVDNVDNVDTVSSRISNIYPTMQVSAGLFTLNSAKEIQTSVNTQIQAAQNNLDQVQNIGLAEIGIAVIADAAIILFIMLYSVRERTKEIGTLKAMGASSTTILGQLMLEGVLLSVLAAVVAVVISGLVAAPLANLLLPRPIEIGRIGSNVISIRRNPGGYTPISVTITPEIMLTSIGFALLLGVVGSVYPALKAAKTRPAEAMRYE